MRRHGGEKQRLGADTGSIVNGAGTLRQVRAPLRLQAVRRLHNGSLASPFRGLDFIRSFVWRLRARLSRKYKALVSVAVGEDEFEEKQRKVEELEDPLRSVHQTGPC